MVSGVLAAEEGSVSWYAISEPQLPNKNTIPAANNVEANNKVCFIAPPPLF
jgi:hypothetical protein